MDSQEKMENKEFRRDGRDAAVLFVHGILEGPGQFCDLCGVLPHNYAVTRLLLPGHGGTSADFAGSSMEHWLEHVCVELRRLQGKYDRILLAGHSLGCLLAVSATLRFPEGVRGLFLIAPPLRMQLTAAGARNGLRAALHRVDESDPVSRAARDACSIGLPQLTGYFSWLPRYAELFRQGATSRKEIMKISVPVRAVFSGRDEFVSLRSAEYFCGKSNVKTIFLPESGHFYYQPQERERLRKCFRSFCKLTLDNC